MAWASVWLSPVLEGQFSPLPMGPRRFVLLPSSLSSWSDSNSWPLGRDLDLYEPIPVDADHIRVRRVGIHRPDADPPNVLPGQEDWVEHREAIQGHLTESGTYFLAVHAPTCPSCSLEVHRMDSPHDLVRRASSLYLPIRPHTTVQASWPVEQPRDGIHLLHLLLEFDRPKHPAETTFLVDCRGVQAAQGSFVTFVDKRDLTAGELFAILRDRVTCQQPPAGILVNNQPLIGLELRRYSNPLIRLLTWGQWDARASNEEVFVPATFSTLSVLNVLPSFLALSMTYEAFLSRQFGEVHRGEVGTSDTTTTTQWTPLVESTAVPTTTSTSTLGPARGVAVVAVHPHPLDPVDTQPIRLHLFTAFREVLTSNVAASDKIEVLLYKLSRSMHERHRLQAGETFLCSNRAVVTPQAVHLLLATSRAEASARFWVIAVPWHNSPLLLRCGDGYSRIGLFQCLGVPEAPEHVVSIEGTVYRRSIHPRNGDVVVVAPASHMVHRLPLMALLHRLPDVQALLFRHTGPSEAAMQDDQLHRVF